MVAETAATPARTVAQGPAARAVMDRATTQVEAEVADQGKMVVVVVLHNTLQVLVALVAVVVVDLADQVAGHIGL